MSIARSVEAPDPVRREHGGSEPKALAGSAATRFLQAAPVALSALILLLVAWSQGAYALRYWGPLAVFVLVSLTVGGSIRRAGRWERVAVGALWGFAAWSLLSAMWAESAARALEGGARNALYAGLFTLPIATVFDRRVARGLAAALLLGVAATAVATYGGILFDGPGLFLAGRLDDPIGYRNATAALFVVAFWPLVCVAAVRRHHPLLRAVAFGIAVLSLGLAFLTQSRGMVIGLVAGGIAAVALGPDRLRRCWLALAAAALLAVVAGQLLTPYDAFVEDRVVTEAQIAIAARALGIVSAVAFVIVGILAILDNGLRFSDASRKLASRGAAVALVAGAVAVSVAAVAVIGNPFDLAADKVQEFRGQEVTTGSTRLGSTGGQRSDLWRVAVEEFRTAPIAGIGQGNYVTQYYERRDNDRNLTDPHSLPLAILSETGIVGALLFVTFLGAVAFGLARNVRAADPATRRWASALAGGGVVVLAQAGVDWFWLLPGVTGVALLWLGLALAASRSEPLDTAAPAGPRWTRVGSLLPLACALLVGALFFSDFQVRRAATARASSPVIQLGAARSAERLNPFSVTPHYLQAGALESLGRLADARQELRDALELEPDNFATMALLGDLAFRAGDKATARRWYRAALERNPLDVGLRKLAGA